MNAVLLAGGAGRDAEPEDSDWGEARRGFRVG